MNQELHFLTWAFRLLRIEKISYGISNPDLSLMTPHCLENYRLLLLPRCCLLCAAVKLCRVWKIFSKALAHWAWEGDFKAITAQPIPLPSGAATLLLIDWVRIRIDFHRMALLILLDCIAFFSGCLCTFQQSWRFLCHVFGCAQSSCWRWEWWGRGCWHREAGDEILYKSFLVNQI